MPFMGGGINGYYYEGVMGFPALVGRTGPDSGAQLRSHFWDWGPSPVSIQGGASRVEGLNTYGLIARSCR